MAAARSVDVRDMLCAQALAVVAQVVARVAAGASVAIRYNSDDVKHDLLTWAAVHGHAVREQPGAILDIERHEDS